MNTQSTNFKNVSASQIEKLQVHANANSNKSNKKETEKQPEPYDRFDPYHLYGEG